MSILLLVRNFVPAHEVSTSSTDLLFFRTNSASQMIERGDWQVSDIARNAFDLEGKVVGTIGAGRIGYRVLQRLLPFDCKELLYYDYAPLPEGMLLSVLECIIPKQSSGFQVPRRPSTPVELKTSKNLFPWLVSYNRHSGHESDPLDASV